jgi:hypothetical protein
VTDNVVSRLKSNRAQGRVGPGDPRGGGGTPPSGIPPGVYYADLTLGGQPITVKLLVREHKRDSGTQARYLYTTDPSLSGEEACRVGDRGTPRDVKALGLLVLEEGEASGLPHDLHHQQRRQGADRGAEPGERGGVPEVLERRLG